MSAGKSSPWTGTLDQGFTRHLNGRLCEVRQLPGGVWQAFVDGEHRLSGVALEGSLRDVEAMARE